MGYVAVSEGCRTRLEDIILDEAMITGPATSSERTHASSAVLSYRGNSSQASQVCLGLGGSCGGGYVTNADCTLDKKCAGNSSYW